jgi:hypothetical protein
MYVCVESDTHKERERERERERESDDGLLVEGVCSSSVCRRSVWRRSVWRRRSSISMLASVEDDEGLSPSRREYLEEEIKYILNKDLSSIYMHVYTNLLLHTLSCQVLVYYIHAFLHKCT